MPLRHYRNLWDPTLVLADMLAAISRAKDEVANAAAYRALAEGMLTKASDDEDRIRAEKCLEVALIFDVYEKLLSEHYIASRVNLGDAAEEGLTQPALKGLFAGKPFRPTAAMPQLRW